MFLFILISVSRIVLSFGQPHDREGNGEPICSKFDYEEKLLEKMIRMEIKMEKIIEGVKEKEKGVQSITTALTQKVADMENNAIQFQRGVNQTMITFANSFMQEQTKLSVLADKICLPIVGFNARLTSFRTTVNKGNKVIYDNIIFNEGEGYDSSTGIFTAPYTGLFFFSAHVCNDGKKSIVYAIHHEGAQLTISVQEERDGSYSCSSVSTVAMVNKAERVWVQSFYSSVLYTDGHRWNTFVGYLINQ